MLFFELRQDMVVRHRVSGIEYLVYSVGRSGFQLLRLRPKARQIDGTERMNMLTEHDPILQYLEPNGLLV